MINDGFYFVPPIRTDWGQSAHRNDGCRPAEYIDRAEFEALKRELRLLTDRFEELRDHVWDIKA